MAACVSASCSGGWWDWSSALRPARPSDDLNGEPQATETETEGDGDGEGEGDGDGDSDSGDGDGDGDDGDDEPECTEPGQWVVADPGECLPIADALRKVDPPPPHNYVEEERGYIAIDGAGKAHIITQRVHFKDVQGDNLETGEWVDSRIIYRTNESGAWIEKAVSPSSGWWLRTASRAPSICWPSDHDTGFRELAHLHYEAGTLEQQILTARHTDSTLAVQPDGTLHTCTEVSYEHGHDADSWISVDWQQLGSTSGLSIARSQPPTPATRG